MIMNSELPLSTSHEKAKRDYILNFFRKRGLISSEDNVIFSEKLFKLNAVLRWCLDKIQHKQMNPEEWKKYNKAIAQYLAGIVDLEWGDNSFKIIELKRNEPRRRTKR